MQEGNASYEQLHPLAPWEDILMGGGDVFSGMGQGFIDTQMADVNENGYVLCTQYSTLTLTNARLSMTHSARYSYVPGEAWYVLTY